METQQSINKWATENFGEATTLTKLRRCCDEMFEAMEVCVINCEQTRTMFTAMRMCITHLDQYEHTPDHMKHLTPLVAEEVADVCIVMMHTAEAIGIDLQMSIDAKMSVNRKRVWHVKGDGTAQHVELNEKVSGQREL